MEIKPQDFRVETFRGPNQGGFSRSVEIGVRVTHIPTGVVAQCYEERSQHMNKKFAYEEVLRLLTEPKQLELFHFEMQQVMVYNTKG